MHFFIHFVMVFSMDFPHRKYGSFLHPFKSSLIQKQNIFCLITRKLFSKFKMHGFLNKVEVEYTTNRSNLTYLDSLLFDFLQSSCSKSVHLIFKSFFLLYFEDTYILFNLFSRQNFSTQPACAQLKTKWRSEVASFSCKPLFRANLALIQSPT